jgi:coenzyme F420-reducing hydrogenase beta subunit
MGNDTDGFLYPSVNLECCINCRLCEKVCPILNKQTINNQPEAFACFNKNEQIRIESSSGGVYTIVAEQVLDNGGVVFGVSLDNDLTAVHSFVESKDQLSIFRGSKYMQSKIGNAYNQAETFLKQNRQVLFTGTPCQIAALKSYLKRDYENLFCMDIVCHGVPSQKVWKKYIQYHENRTGAKVVRAGFRNKNKGWKLFSMSLSFDNSSQYTETLDKDLYMKAFLKNVSLRPSCYNCNFKTLNRQSDITLADFWGIQIVLPELDDDKGTSLVLINSVKGSSMFDSIKDSISCKSVDINKAIIPHNTAAISSVHKNPNREKFFEELDSVPFDKLVNKYCSEGFAVTAKRKARSLAAAVLKRTGLLKVVKKVIKR